MHIFFNSPEEAIKGTENKKHSEESKKKIDVKVERQIIAHS